MKLLQDNHKKINDMLPIGSRNIFICHDDGLKINVKMNIFGNTQTSAVVN